MTFAAYFGSCLLRMYVWWYSTNRYTIVEEEGVDAERHVLVENMLQYASISQTCWRLFENSRAAAPSSISFRVLE
jgi:hypothetical protein